MNEFLAATSWETLDLVTVWRSLDQLLESLDTPRQVQLAGRAIEHLVELFVTSSEQVFEELDATLTQDGPRMTIAQFAPFVRQSMEIDFAQFVGEFERDETRGPYAPRMPELKGLPEDEQTIVAIVDAATLADAVEGLEFTVEAEMDLEAAIKLAHVEDIEGWAKAISAYLEKAEAQMVSLHTLQQSLNLPWIEVWLGLLLGGYQLERQGNDFYSSDIWVRNQTTVPAVQSAE